ncbi:MAG TPA: hypothetical protein VMU04_10960 [Candidatus Acidoferrum sp.]|nr:hypothetical protein [Candidatus Acidoferrum sp.]
MKTKLNLLSAGLALAFFSTLTPLSSALADTTIDAVNRYAWGANIGWINGVADTNNGAVIGEYVCSGYLYSANVGWIALGSGAPANGIRYQNNSATDFGVNNYGLGNLIGYAWGANVGWITFEQTYGQPRVNLLTGQLSGYLWSANCGWISLNNAAAYVQTDTIRQGTLAPDGLPVAWLLSNFGTTNISANDDPTGKGMTIAQDYVAGTDPNNVNSVLRIIAEGFGPGGTTANLTWSSVPTRLYYIQKTASLTTPWMDSGLGLVSPAGGASTTTGFDDINAPTRFYRVQAVLPLPLQTYTLTTASYPPAGGSVTLSPSQPSYAEGTQVTLTAVPEPGYLFATWWGDFGAGTNPLVITVSTNITVNANFALIAPIQNYTNRFDTAPDAASWTAWWGPPIPAVSWDTAEDAEGNPASGSLKVTEAFTGAAGEQFMVFGTLANRWAWDNGLALDCTRFTNVMFDLKVEPGTCPTVNNDYGPLEIWFVDIHWNPFHVASYEVPLSATNWTHVVQPIDPELPDLNCVTGVGFHIWSNGLFTNGLTFHVDNVTLQIR